MKHSRDDYNRIQDPLQEIPEDEPVFLLRGQDVSAPAAVMAWAEGHINSGGDIELFRRAVRQAFAMQEWQEEHGAKVADLPCKATS